MNLQFGMLMICLQQRVEREIAEHEFVDRLFYFWDTEYRGALSFQVCAVD